MSIHYTNFNGLLTCYMSIIMILWCTVLPFNCRKYPTVLDCRKYPTVLDFKCYDSVHSMYSFTCLCNVS